jgi:hypothetical protein
MAIYDPGMKDSFDAIAGILQLTGQAEKHRQQRQATEAILGALADGDDDGLKKAIEAAQGFQAKYGTGIQKLLQKIGAANMTGESPGMAALSEAGIPVVKMRSDLQESQARQEHYKRAYASESGLFAQDAQGNMRSLKPGESPLPGERAVRASADRQRSQSDLYASLATAQAAMQDAKSDEDKAWWRNEIDSLRAERGGGTTYQTRTNRTADMISRLSGGIVKPSALADTPDPLGAPNGENLVSKQSTGEIYQLGPGNTMRPTGVVQARTEAPSTPAFTRTATNPETGQKIGWDGRKWVAIP